MIEILASGAIGALLATVLAGLISLLLERVRLRVDVAKSVIAWADDTYVRLVDLHVSKKAAYTSDKPHLSEEEYAYNSRELRSLLLRASVPFQLSLAYGEGTATRLLNQLREHELCAARMLWRSREDTWDEVHVRVKAFLANEVDPLRAELRTRLLDGATVRAVWRCWRHALEEGPQWGAIGTASTPRDNRAREGRRT